MTEMLKFVAVFMFNAEGECETACRCYAGPDREDDYQDMKQEALDECEERYSDLSPVTVPVRQIVQHYEAPVPVWSQVISSATLPEQAEGETTATTTIS